MKVLDSSGIINARDKEIDGRFLTIPEVKTEIKDIQARLKLEAAIAEKKITFEEPSKKAISDVHDAAETNGALSLLSDTDIKVLALAHEKNLPIVTDDYDVQNMCMVLGLGFERISMRGIKEKLVWKKKCSACGKEYAGDIAECEACGSRTFSVSRR